MNKQDILNRIISLLAQMTEYEGIEETSELLDDLELSSLDVFTMLGELEDYFQISIPEKLIRQMVIVEDVCDIVMKQMKEQR